MKKIDPSFAIDEPHDSDLTAIEMLACFGIRLRVARMANSYHSAKALADAIEVDENTYMPWERGRSYPTLLELRKIRRLLCVTTDWLYFGDATHLTVGVFRRIQAKAEIYDASLPHGEDG